MNFSYNWLQSFFQKKLPKPQKLAEILTMRFAGVEGIERRGKDFVLDIDVRPNRAGDCFSHLGIARECAALLNWKLEVGNWKLIENRKVQAKDFVSVEVKDKAACPRYTARVITDVKVGLSPKWIKDRLIVCGLRPINNVVDIANYVMLETGQPLHAFDNDKLEGQKIIVRFAKIGEKIVTLDGQKFDLSSDILVIADEKKPVAIAGIKGGKLPEIDKKTKIVVLESANFEPKTIRRGSKKLNLKTDASWRFEHGIDPNLTEFAINRTAFLIQKITKGKVAQGLVDAYPKKVLPKIIRLDLDYVEKLLGVKIPKIEIKNILERLGLKIENWKLKILNVVVPTLRPDISIPEDLIEEIGRIYGYQKIQAVFPVSALIPPKRNLDIFWEDMAENILKEAGFTEVYNYSFFGEKEAKLFAHKEKELVEVQNPISQEYKYLRVSLIPNLLKNIEKNQRYFSEIKIFELGKIFRKEPKKVPSSLPSLSRAIAKAKRTAFSSLPSLLLRKSSAGEEESLLSSPSLRESSVSEKRMLTGVMTGEAFYEAKGIVDLLLNKLGISNVWFAEPSAHLTPHPAKRGSAYDEYKPTPEESKLSIWHPKKCAEIKINGKELGFLGEVSPKILTGFEIKGRVVLFDIDFEKLSRLASEEHEYRPISKFPSAIRDVAILVPRNVRVAQVLNKIYDSGGKLIRDVDLFDIYEGEEMPAGKKNLAFHIIYQAEDRTLSSKEIDALQNKVIKALEEEPEWTVRK